MLCTAASGATIFLAELLCGVVPKRSKKTEKEKLFFRENAASMDYLTIYHLYG